MRRAHLTALGFAAATGGALVACVDLFHSTDYTTPDPVDAAPAADVVTPPKDAAPLGDFCAMRADEGKTLALHACALLAACETPFGRNATGKCLEKALPVIACAGAHDRPASGAVLSFYRCLAIAKTCADIDRCVFPAGKPPRCGPNAPFTACAETPEQKDVRVDCRTTDVPAEGGEVCAAYGQHCALDRNATSRCVGESGAFGCRRTGCEGDALHLCVDGGSPDASRDEGFDCAPLGGSCVEPNDGGVFGCHSRSNIPCPASAAVHCSGSVATGCPTGIQESVDCAALFDTRCNEIADAGREVAWDVARACNVAPDGGACTSDTCSGATLYACVRGKPVAVDCAALFGTTCARVDTTDGANVATCTPP